MDYTGLINLALVTVLFSALLAPHLKKISDIRSSIAEVDFPIVPRMTVGDEVDKFKSERALKGIELSKKITQYSDTYKEARTILLYFYLILVIVTIVQFIFLYLQGQILTTSGLLFGGTLIILFVVVISIKSHMTQPATIRSIQWLASKNISETHASAVASPHLFINDQSRNNKADYEKVSFSLRTGTNLYGYGYLFVIESPDQRKLYVMTYGFVGEYSTRTNLAFRDGSVGSRMILARAKLKPGKYKARLLFLTSPFDGEYEAGETSMEFSVNTRGVPVSEKKLVHVSLAGDSGYIFTFKHRGQKHKVSNIYFDESSSRSMVLSMILSSNEFRQRVAKTSRPIALISTYGDIDRYDITASLKRTNLARVWFKKKWNGKFKTKTGHLLLLDRSQKSGRKD